MEDRLQKILSSSGICSRRKAEEYITAGRVTVNGTPANLGDRADPEKDTIALDGKPITKAAARTVLMMNKPRGVVTTLSDERGRKTVADLLKTGRKGTVEHHVWPVGRLDMDSEGLLILTDDGDLTNALIHPRHEVEKEYLVWVTEYTDEGLVKLEKPMKLDGQKLRPARVTYVRKEGDRTLLSIIIHEGKNRQVRRMCAECGMTVRRLYRVREGRLKLDPNLKPGQWRPLTEKEIGLLK